MSAAVKLSRVEELVLERVVALTAGGRADVDFAELVKPYPGPGPSPSTRDVMVALARLKAERFLTTLTTYGVGREGLPLLEARRAAAGSAPPQGANTTLTNNTREALA